ncbi:hypothetical protein JCM10207_007249 [Rhodosporidiobolus poonsookiae]
MLPTARHTSPSPSPFSPFSPSPSPLPRPTSLHTPFRSSTPSVLVDPFNSLSIADFVDRLVDAAEEPSVVRVCKWVKELRVEGEGGRVMDGHSRDGRVALAAAGSQDPSIEAKFVVRILRLAGATYKRVQPVGTDGRSLRDWAAEVMEEECEGANWEAARSLLGATEVDADIYLNRILDASKKPEKAAAEPSSTDSPRRARSESPSPTLLRQLSRGALTPFGGSGKAPQRPFTRATSAPPVVSPKTPVLLSRPRPSLSPLVKIEEEDDEDLEVVSYRAPSTSSTVASTATKRRRSPSPPSSDSDLDLDLAAASPRPRVKQARQARAELRLSNLASTCTTGALEALFAGTPGVITVTCRAEASGEVIGIVTFASEAAAQHTYAEKQGSIFREKPLELRIFSTSTGEPIVPNEERALERFRSEGVEPDLDPRVGPSGRPHLPNSYFAACGVGAPRSLGVALSDVHTAAGLRRRLYIGSLRYGISAEEIFDLLTLQVGVNATRILNLKHAEDCSHSFAHVQFPDAITADFAKASLSNYLYDGHLIHVAPTNELGHSWKYSLSIEELPPVWSYRDVSDFLLSTFLPICLNFSALSVSHGTSSSAVATTRARVSFRYETELFEACRALAGLPIESRVLRVEIEQKGAARRYEEHRAQGTPAAASPSPMRWSGAIFFSGGYGDGSLGATSPFYGGGGGGGGGGEGSSARDSSVGLGAFGALDLANAAAVESGPLTPRWRTAAYDSRSPALRAADGVARFGAIGEGRVEKGKGKTPEWTGERDVAMEEGEVSAGVARASRVYGAAGGADVGMGRPYDPFSPALSRRA